MFTWIIYHHMNEMIIHNCLKRLQRVVAPDEPMSSPPTAEPAGQTNKAFMYCQQSRCLDFKKLNTYNENASACLFIGQ